MSIHELIKILNDHIRAHGDAPIDFLGVEIADIVYLKNENKYVLISQEILNEVNQLGKDNHH